MQLLLLLLLFFSKSWCCCCLLSVTVAAVAVVVSLVVSLNVGFALDSAYDVFCDTSLKLGGWFFMSTCSVLLYLLTWFDCLIPTKKHFNSIYIVIFGICKNKRQRIVE